MAMGDVRGVSSHYGCGDGFHGRLTASGKVFNAYGLTAAHRSLPFGTKLQVYLTDKAGNRKGKPVVVTITDRGPFSRGRVLDLSCGAARALGFYRQGVARVIGKVLR
jgi:rare lipoprotein A